MAVFTDPEGAAFRVWQANEHRGAQIVNEPGSLNFNGLNTRDVDGAKSFYGCGVRVAGAQPSAAALEMWRLPGYGDFLAERDPGLARADGGRAAVRQGFEDVVATLNPITGRSTRMPRRTGA